MRIRDVLPLRTEVGSDLTGLGQDGRRVVVVAPDTDVRQALRLMDQEKVAQVAVVQGERYLGTVEVHDIVRCSEKVSAKRPHRCVTAYTRVRHERV